MLTAELPSKVLPIVVWSICVSSERWGRTYFC